LKNVATWRCREPEALSYVLGHLNELVVKEVNGSGGYGMLVGPHASGKEIETFRQKLLVNPDNFIASRPCRFPPARPPSPAAWRRAMSTFVLSSSRAPTAFASCRAA